MKYALITGGSRGIGREICLKLAEDGYSIIINYKANEEKAKEVKKAIEDIGGKAELLPFDTSSPQSIEEAMERWQSKNQDSHISVLVHNAGITDDSLLFMMSDSQWHNVLDTSLNGFFYLSRLIVKDMMASRWGRIVVVSSLSGVKGMAGQVNYSAAKGALISASKALAIEVARRGVTVNVVAPGFIRTDMTGHLSEMDLKATIPMGRFGQASEVAEAVAFFASEKSSYITGTVLNVNGGLYT